MTQLIYGIILLCIAAISTFFGGVLAKSRREKSRLFSGIILLCIGTTLMCFGGVLAKRGWDKLWPSVNLSTTTDQKEVYKIDPLILGHMTAIDLLSSTATIEFVTDVQTIKLQKTLFSIKYENFKFSLDFNNGTIILNRCNNVINHKIRATNPTEKIKIRISYEPQKMSMLVGDNILFAELAQLPNELEKEKYLSNQFPMATFAPVYPPNSMLKWVRKEQLIPVKEYQTYENLLDSISSMIVSLENKISDSNMYAAFWDKNDVKPIQIPKKEEEIHRILLGLIQDECLLKSLEINHENTVENKKFDFYISGFVKGVGMKGVCIEAIHAHNQKLKEGLLFQLPTYMKSKSADFGIFLVLWFKGKNFDSPIYENYHSMEDDLHKQKILKGYGKMIRIITLNLSVIPEALEDIH